MESDGKGWGYPAVGMASSEVTALSPAHWAPTLWHSPGQVAPIHWVLLAYQIIEAVFLKK